MLGKTVCRACDSTNMYGFLAMGDHPAANAFVRPEKLSEPDQLFPLESHACLDCGLIQIPDPLPADFYVDYVYMPSATTSFRPTAWSKSTRTSRRSMPPPRSSSIRRKTKAGR